MILAALWIWGICSSSFWCNFTNAPQHFSLLTLVYVLFFSFLIYFILSLKNCTCSKKILIAGSILTGNGFVIAPARKHWQTQPDVIVESWWSPILFFHCRNFSIQFVGEKKKSILTNCLHSCVESKHTKVYERNFILQTEVLQTQL